MYFAGADRAVNLERHQHVVPQAISGRREDIPAAGEHLLGEWVADAAEFGAVEQIRPAVPERDQQRRHGAAVRQIEGQRIDAAQGGGCAPVGRRKEILRRGPPVQSCGRRHARGLQRVGGADAGKLQQAGRAHRAAADDHLAVGSERLDARAAGDRDARRATLLDLDLQRLRVETDGKVRAPLRRLQESAGSGRAFGVAGVDS